MAEAFGAGSSGDSGGSRTHGTRFRRAMLYPLSYRARSYNGRATSVIITYPFLFVMLP